MPEDALLRKQAFQVDGVQRRRPPDGRPPVGNPGTATCNRLALIHRTNWTNFVETKAVQEFFAGQLSKETDKGRRFCVPLNGAPGLRRPLPCLVTHERGTVALRGEVLARGALDILTSVRSVSVGYHGVDITQVRCALFNTASKWFISTDSWNRSLLEITVQPQRSHLGSFCLRKHSCATRLFCIHGEKVDEGVASIPSWQCQICQTQLIECCCSMRIGNTHFTIKYSRGGETHFHWTTAILNSSEAC